MHRYRFRAGLSLTLALCASVLVFEPASTSSLPPTTAKRRNASVHASPRQQYPPQAYAMPLTYYSVLGDLQTRLTLNNKSGRPVTPTLVLYAPDGRRYTHPSFEIAPATFTEIDLRRLVGIAGLGFETGSIRVSYTGLPTQLGGMLRMTNTAAGIEFSEALMYPTSRKSNRLEAVWSVLTDDTAARLAVTNTTGTDVDVTISFWPSWSRRAERTETIRLGPWQLQVLDFSARRVGPAARSGGVSIEYSGAAGGVKARGLLADYSTGYSSVVEFSDPAVFETSAYHGTGVRLLPVDRGQMEPMVLARNTSDVWVALRGRLQVTTEGQGISTIDLPFVSMAPREVISIDVRDMWSKAAKMSSSPTAGIEFDYSGAPGSVLVSVVTLTEDYQHVFRVPLVDPGTSLAAAAEYFWHLEGTRTSVVHLKNVTDKLQRYHLYLRHEEGVWSMGLKTLRPHESVSIDIGELKIGQTPDVRKRTIPDHVMRGQVHWSIAGGKDPKAIDGRMEQVDFAVGVSSTYACGVYEPDQFDYAWIVPDENDPPEIDMDQQTQFRVWEQDVDFLDHHPEDPIEITDLLTWTNNDSNIASSFGGGWYTGVSEGTASEEVSGESVGYNESMNHEPIWFDFQIQVRAAYPVNFNPTTVTGSNGGSGGAPLPYLHANYTWESSTGNIAHLSTCEVWEEVIHSPFDSPPFQGQSSNISRKLWDASSGSGTDIHAIDPVAGPLLLSGGSPIAGRADSSQRYKYKCGTGPLTSFSSGNSGLFDIYRTVTFASNVWAFKIEKHNGNRSCELEKTGTNAGWCK